MSLLRNQSVNPLNNPAPAAAPVEVPQQPPVISHAELAYVATAAVNPSPTQAVPQSLVPAPQMSIVQTPVSADGGFDDLDIGYGSFPRITLQNSIFEFDGENMGTEFQANLSQVTKLFVYRDKKASDNSARVVYSYDMVTTTSGEPLAPIFQQWRAEGFGEPQMEQRAEAIALVTSGPFEGQMAICSIPKTGSEKLKGYTVQLRLMRGRTVPSVITRVHAGSPIKLNNGTNFIPWSFEYAGEFNVAQAA